jgi:hypothetical protein
MRQLPETEMLHVPGAVACELVDAPAGRTFQPFYVLDAQQGGENAANPVDQITPDSPLLVILDKAFQPSMPDSANPHFNRTVGPDTLSSALPTSPFW